MRTAEANVYPPLMARSRRAMTGEGSLCLASANTLVSANPAARTLPVPAFASRHPTPSSPAPRSILPLENNRANPSTPSRRDPMLPLFVARTRECISSWRSERCGPVGSGGGVTPVRRFPAPITPNLTDERPGAMPPVAAIRSSRTGRGSSICVARASEAQTGCRPGRGRHAESETCTIGDNRIGPDPQRGRLPS